MDSEEAGLNDSLSAESGLSMEDNRLKVEDGGAASSTFSSTEELGRESLHATVQRLQDQLIAKSSELASKEKECKLIQTTVDAEVHELTETLFKEAYKLADDANHKRRKADKVAAEAEGKCDLLQAEVDALKIIVQQHASSPAKGLRRGSFQSPFTTPNRAQQAAASPARRAEGMASGAKARLFALTSGLRGVDLGADEAEAEELVCPNCGQPPPVKLGSDASDTETAGKLSRRSNDVDPLFHRQFLDWREAGGDLSDPELPFVKRIYEEDILPSLSFSDEALSAQVRKAIQEDGLTLEEVKEERPHARECELLRTVRLCPYRLKLGEEEPWRPISQHARDRIAAVCELLRFLRYLAKGIVKMGVHEAYWEIMTRRRDVVLTRIGLPVA